MRRWLFWIFLMLFLGGLMALPAGSRAAARVADGFDMPVGKPNGDGYYMSRGFLSYHPGEDWNGVAGGNSDLGGEGSCGLQAHQHPAAEWTQRLNAAGIAAGG